MTFTLTNTASHQDTGDSQLSLDATANQSAQDVKLIYPSAENDYRITTAIIPAGSKFHAGAHWHEDYDEVMRVVKGRAKIRLGKVWRVVTPDDGEVLIPKKIVHDVMRADADAPPGEGDDGEVWIEERSEPVDGSKELFFRHAFSITADKAAFGWKFPLQMLLTLMYTDGYLYLVPEPASWYVTHGLFGLIRPVAGWIGLRPFYDEYTPARLSDIRKKLEEKGKPKKE